VKVAFVAVLETLISARVADNLTGKYFCECFLNLKCNKFKFSKLIFDIY
jgi:hypothetical protein